MSETLTKQEEKYFETKGQTPPEAPQEQPKPEAVEAKAEEPKAEPKPEPKEEKVVPLRALQEEREEAKRLRAEIASQRELIARGNQRLEQFIQANQPRPQLPDDPVERIETRLNNIDQRVQNYGEAQNQKAQWEHFVNAVKSHENQFLRVNPDYYDALNHVRQSRLDEYQYFGMGPGEAQQRVAQEEMMIAQAALREGVNPAQRVYEAAIKRGYTKKQAEKTVEKALETVAKGQEAAKSLAATPGGSKSNIDIAALAKMDEDEFEAFVTDQKKWKKVWGE